MLRGKISLLLLALFTCFANGDYKDIVLDQGVVRGYNTDADDVISFFGIPYATAPTGEDRFKAPLPASSWNDTLNATEYSVVCLQSYEYDPRILVPKKVYDCLTINVFIPKDTNETNLPVLFQIHGGGLQMGYPNELSPVDLVSRGMIAVNFRYRLGLQGFLCLNTEYAPGNAAMKDMIAALVWVRDNIAKFGGDPDNISMCGPSAGGTAAELVLLSPMSNGLLARALLQSGGALTHNIAIMEPLPLAEKFANQYGVYTNESVALLESFYRSLSDDEFNTAYETDSEYLGFMPCVETHDLEGVEKFLSEPAIDIITSGNYEPIPMMTAFTSMEGIDFYSAYEFYKVLMEANFTAFIPNNVVIESEEHAEELTEKIRDFYFFPTGEITYLGFVNYFTDTFFAYAMYVSSRLHTQNGANVNLYYFTYNGTINLPNRTQSPIWGPGHVAESLYIYDYYAQSIYENVTDSDREVQSKLRDIHFSYFKNGTVYLETTDWIPVTTDTVNALNVVNGSFYMIEFPLRERFEFWDEIFQYDYTSNDTDCDLLL